MNQEISVTVCHILAQLLLYPKALTCSRTTRNVLPFSIFFNLFVHCQWQLRKNNTLWEPRSGYFYLKFIQNEFAWGGSHLARNQYLLFLMWTFCNIRLLHLIIVFTAWIKWNEIPCTRTEGTASCSYRGRSLARGSTVLRSYSGEVCPGVPILHCL